MELQSPRSTTTVFLDQPPSCLQFCPAIANQFVVGTYLLSENKDDEGNIQQTKTGSLQLWKLNPGSPENSLYAPPYPRADPELIAPRSLIQKIPLPYAVFDLHFHPTNPSILAIASSAASVALFQVSATEITHLWTRPVHEDPSIPALFLAWTPPKWLSQDDADGFAVTFSDGTTSVFGAQVASSREEDKGLARASASNDITELGSFAARQMIEVWFVALATYDDEPASPQSSVPFLFTGNDFGSLHTRRFDRSAAGDAESTDLLPPLLLEHDDRARHHSAGVTSILPLPLPLQQGAPVLLTGSYDEYLRVYHATRTGEVLAEACLGGGVWRLQLLKTERVDEGDDGERWTFLVLASCMHAGTRVVRVTWKTKESFPAWEIVVLAEFTEHQSMNYASDVWKPEGGYDLQGNVVTELLCVSSSFYDKRLCTWRVSV
ncbi:conserved hypothetical protein [Aspergillus terreus NIH2624]|uniref:Diphthine methyltransferase n=1 Tax=Aspergillus terreus (strain NIH 2624 / FGSC A1156) TaxID=341663 RepID=Q0CXJ7_ASPTN|nr:uncharacterized protein ATEG_01587 [Aspergillus terreus NIH2624]EAU38344.1 conserved hypothetical protein [Aspergillus terreus NIH2624]